jgi:hypothetical protein|eukprot:XP_020404662.1 uncharacterized protein LOC109944343 [Zea mays]
MADRPRLPPSFPAAGDPPSLLPFPDDGFPPLPLSYRAAVAAPLAAALLPAARAPLPSGAPPGRALVAAAAGPAPAPPSPGPAPLLAPTPSSSPSVVTTSPPPAAALPPAHAPVQSLGSDAAHGAALALTATVFSPDFPSIAFSLPDAAFLRSQLLAPGFPHVPLGTTVGAPVRDCPPLVIVYSQPSAVTSSLRAPSDDAAAILAATRSAVAAARQRAQDAARALEQEQAVVDAIERQYAETYRRLAGKGVSDDSPTSARHCADTFESAPAPASTLRASLHAQAAALTSIRATVTDVLASDSTQYPRWRDQVLQTLRCYALADHVLSPVPDPTED